MSAFDKLSREAQRAAFAHMSTGSAAKKVAKAAVTKKPGASKGPDLTKQYQHVGLGSDGNLQSHGTISGADAAAVMFGTKGAQKRIAKAKASARKSK